MARLDQLNEMLAARLDAAGKPKKGYRENVLKIQAEIALLLLTGQPAPTTDSQESAPEVSP